MTSPSKERASPRSSSSSAPVAQQLRRARPAQHAQALHGRAGGVGRRVEPGVQGLGQGGRRPSAGPELEQEQRVAGGAGHQGLAGGVVEVRVVTVDEGPGRVAIERCDRHVGEAGRDQLVDDRRRMGADHPHGRDGRDEGGHPTGHRERPLVGPLEVVEQQAAGPVPEHAGDHPVDLDIAGVVDDVAQQRERHPRQRGPRRGLTDGGSIGEHRAGQRGLPDAGLAGQHHGSSRADGALDHLHLCATNQHHPLLGPALIVAHAERGVAAGGGRRGRHAGVIVRPLPTGGTPGVASRATVRDGGVRGIPTLCQSRAPMCDAPPMRTFTVAERRARLGRRHHLAPGHRADDVVAAAADLVGLHATDGTTVHLAAWARVDGLVVADVDRALHDDRTLVRQMAMRRTIWAVPRCLHGTVVAAAGHRVAGQERRRLAKDVVAEGLATDGAAWVEEAEAAAVEALARLGAASASELREQAAILAATITYAPGRTWGRDLPVAPRVLTGLWGAGRIVRGENRGPWTAARPTWVRTEDWLGGPVDEPPEEEARADLVRRWLRTFGPATLDDVVWWFGATKTSMRAALLEVGAVEVDLGDRPGVVLPDDLDPEPPLDPWAALLPSLDPATMGWKERDWYLGAHREDLFDTVGNGGTTAWWDGRIVGGWDQTDDGEVVVRLLEEVGSEGRTALEREAERLTAWLGGTRVGTQLLSPLSRRSRPEVGGRGPRREDAAP